jgi:hypothetical protein
MDTRKREAMLAFWKAVDPRYKQPPDVGTQIGEVACGRRFSLNQNTP